MRTFSRRIGEDWTDRAIVFGLTLCCLVAGRIWAGGRPMPEAALPGVFVACLIVGLRAPSGELCRRVARAWLAWGLALMYVGAVLGLAHLFSWASDIIWLQSRNAWGYGGLYDALGWAAGSVGPAILGAIVAGAVRWLKPSQRMPSEAPTWDASDVDLFLWLGLLFVVSFVGHQSRGEKVLYLDSASILIGFAFAAWRAPFAEQFARVRKLWVGVLFVTYSFCLLPVLLVALYRAREWGEWAVMSGILFTEFLLDAVAVGVSALLGGGFVWLVRYAYAKRFPRSVERTNAGPLG